MQKNKSFVIKVTPKRKPKTKEAELIKQGQGSLSESEPNEEQQTEATQESTYDFTEYKDAQACVESQQQVADKKESQILTAREYLEKSISEVEQDLEELFGTGLAYDLRKKKKINRRMAGTNKIWNSI